MMTKKINDAKVADAVAAVANRRKEAASNARHLHRCRIAWTLGYEAEKVRLVRVKKAMQEADRSLWQQAREDRANAIDETRRGIRR